MAPRPPEDDRPLSPFYDREQDASGRTVQVRPFYWKHEGPEGKRVNILGPIIRWREDETMRRLEMFPNVYYTARVKPQDRRSWWFMFFPFLFLGHDDFLVFPVGGYSHGLLGLNEFLMVTPLYIRTKSISKAPDKPVTYTVRHVLFPILAWGSDGQPGGRRKFRFAPFFGKQTHRGGAQSGFVLWPFYTWRRSENEHAFFFFPFYGRAEAPTHKDTTVMFPFYHRSRNHLTGGIDTAVWPFWRRAKGSDAIDVRRYWPFYEFRRVGNTLTEVAAWPFWRRTYYEDDREFRKYTWVAPFYKRVRAVSRADGHERKKTTVWPIGRWERYADGGREVAIPVISPIDAPALREFAEPFRPLVSLYHRRTEANGDRETSALFGLYMSRRAGEHRKVRLLGGLLGWGRDGEERHLRLLWAIRLRFGRKR